MQACQDVKGVMFALRASRAEVEARICALGLSNEVAVSASNSNRSCVISGLLPVVMTFVKEWDICYCQLRVSNTFHSNHMQGATSPVDAAL